MTELRRRMLEDLQLRGMSERTQECYLYPYSGMQTLTWDEIRNDSANGRGASNRNLGF